MTEDLLAVMTDRLEQGSYHFDTNLLHSNCQSYHKNALLFPLPPPPLHPPPTRSDHYMYPDQYRLQLYHHASIRDNALRESNSTEMSESECSVTRADRDFSCAVSNAFGEDIRHSVEFDLLCFALLYVDLYNIHL